MTIKPIPKQKVLDEITAYNNCSDFLHDMMYEYHEKILGISLDNIYKIFEERKKFEYNFWKKNKEYPTRDQTYEFVKKLIETKKYYKL